MERPGAGPFRCCGAIARAGRFNYAGGNHDEGTADLPRMPFAGEAHLARRL